MPVVVLRTHVELQALMNVTLDRTKTDLNNNLKPKIMSHEFRFISELIGVLSRFSECNQALVAAHMHLYRHS